MVILENTETLRMLLVCVKSGRIPPLCNLKELNLAYVSVRSVCLRSIPLYTGMYIAVNE